MGRAFLATRVLSVLALLLTWQIVATLAPSRTLPPPGDVFLFIAREVRSGEMPAQIGATLARVLAAFTLAMAVGSAVGVVLGRSRLLDRALDLWLLVLLNTPALVIAVLCYLWLGLTEIAAVAAVALNKLPNVAVTLREGARALDPGLDEMARAYRFSRGTWMRHVLLPQLEPYFAVAARSGLALVWKIVLVVELLGRPNGVGYAISYYFQLFDVRAVLGYSLAFSAVMLLIEYGALQPLEAHARRWRPAPA
jgi:ABC-type nitrate/sulfonate/bicarbonate transport system permease component